MIQCDVLLRIPSVELGIVRPLPSELGACKTVRATFWPWLSDKSSQNL